MDAPPPAEDVRPFIKITKHLASLGYSVPRIMCQDIDAGFLLLEDLGDKTYSNALTAGVDEKRLYQSAVDVASSQHRILGGDMFKSLDDMFVETTKKKALRLF